MDLQPVGASKARSGTWMLAIGVGAGVLLFCWPMLLPDSGGRWLAARLSVRVLFSLWAAFAIAGALFALIAILNYLRITGRAALPGQPPRGLAGKPWGALASNLWLPGALALCFAAFIFGSISGLGGPLVLPALAICGALGFVYVRILWTVQRQRNTLMRRQNEGPGARSAVTRKLDSYGQQALDAVAEVVSVPTETLRSSDRFGTDIGTFSSLDERLDRLGGQLLLQQAAAGQPLSLENIRTIGDFIAEWRRCKQISGKEV